MSLPVKAVDRLFERMIATYGAQWSRQWSVVPIEDVKAAWAHELAGYASHLEALVWALENLPERCPNAIEFRNLCRQAPVRAVKPLPEPAADPARVAEELRKLEAVRNGERRSGKDWARAILARIDAGERVSPAVKSMAHQALGLGV